ncbi:MAG: GNAT family N-acetyltransferase [Ignavibacteria bacterium]|jgi:GNAT superfamily N-acetyltransferase
MIDRIKIKPISLDEWLPDRCLNGFEPFDPNSYLPESGCPSLNYSQKNNRETLEQLYKSTIDKYGGCGFVAWDNNKIIAYHNFFPLEVAKQIKFYGYGIDSVRPDNILIHNCLTIVKGDYLRKGISSRLVKNSIDWARKNNWKRFEVHSVLPDCEKGWQSDQKSCLSFWKRFGFKTFKEYDADKETEQYYGVTKRFSIYLPLDYNN